MNAQTYIAVLAFALSGTLQAASFDCTKAGNRIEHMICDNQAVSDLDSEMANVYKTAIANGDADKIRAEQRAWLKSRVSVKSADELASSYKQRMEQLRAPVAEVPAEVPAATKESNKPVEIVTEAAKTTPFEFTILVIDENGKRTRMTRKEREEFLNTNHEYSYNGDGTVLEHSKHRQAREKAEREAEREARTPDERMNDTAMGFALIDYCSNNGFMVGLGDFVKNDKAKSLEKLKNKIGDHYDSKKMQEAYKMHMAGAVQLLVNTGDIYRLCGSAANQARAEIGAENQF